MRRRRRYRLLTSVRGRASGRNLSEGGFTLYPCSNMVQVFERGRGVRGTLPPGPGFAGQAGKVGVARHPPTPGRRAATGPRSGEGWGSTLVPAAPAPPPLRLPPRRLTRTQRTDTRRKSDDGLDRAGRVAEPHARGAGHRPGVGPGGHGAHGPRAHAAAPQPGRAARARPARARSRRPRPSPTACATPPPTSPRCGPRRRCSPRGPGRSPGAGTG